MGQPRKKPVEDGEAMRINVTPIQDPDAYEPRDTSDLVDVKAVSKFCVTRRALFSRRFG